jgi:hypothetical protein
LTGAFDGVLSIGGEVGVTVLDWTGQLQIRPVTDDHIYVILPLSISAACRAG